MKVLKLEEILVSSLNSYLERKLNEVSTVDEDFDEVYFLHILFQRYKTELTDIIPDKAVLIEMEKRLENTILKIMKVIENKRTFIHKLNLYEQSQVLFTLIGINYLVSLKNQQPRPFFLTNDEIKIIENSLGFSVIFDFMIEFFCKKLGIDLSSFTEVKPKDEVEETYLHTHFFLLETDYFINSCNGDNVSELLLNVDFVLDEKLGDLVAELYWSLNFFKYDNYKVMEKLEQFLLNSYQNGQWVFHYENRRQIWHSQYSCIVAFLEEKKRYKL